MGERAIRRSDMLGICESDNENGEEGERGERMDEGERKERRGRSGRYLEVAENHIVPAISMITIRSAHQ